MQASSSGKREHRHFTGGQKAAIVKAHLVDGAAVSDLCEKHKIQPTQFYQWQKQLFENGQAAFEQKAKPGRKSPQQRKIEQLQAKLADKNEVIAELMEENVKAKKSLGNSDWTLGSPRCSRRSRRLCRQVDQAGKAACEAIGGLRRNAFQQNTLCHRRQLRASPVVRNPG